MTDTPKTIAEMREAAAELAYDMATAYWDLPEGVNYSGEDLRALSGRIRAIPLPADDAEMVEKVARAITHGDPDRICYRRCGHDGFEPIGPAWTLSIDDARAALSAMRGEP